MDGWHYVKAENSEIALQSHLLADVCNEITVNHVQCLQENSEIDSDDKNELDINHMMKEELDLAAHGLIKGDIVFSLTWPSVNCLTHYDRKQL